MNEKKKLLLIVAAAALLTVLLALWSPMQAGVMTFESNIAMSEEADNPPMNDAVETITLTFTEKMDAKTIKDSVKLYRIDASGNAVEEPSIVKIDASDQTVIDINNQNVTGFTQGEEYKIEISSALKSMTGATLAQDYAGYFATNYGLTLTGISALDNERSQVHIISDIHLGINDAFAETVENRQALVDYLNQVRTSPNVKELVIAGDLLDGWFVPMNYELPDSQSAFFDAVAANNQTIVDGINGIIKDGLIKVTYVPGNHDLLLTDADVARIFPGINQARDSVQGLGSYVTGPDSEIVIEHGHKYNFFCAPDPISNRDITGNATSVLPPGYFFTRIATSSVIEGHPKTTNTFPEITVPDKKDASQYDAYLYSQCWQGLLKSGLPVTESLTDKVIKTNIDGYTADYAINDLVPQQNAADGIIDMTLFKDIQNTWDERQIQNGVKAKIPVSEAIAKSADNNFTDQQAQTQFFDLDATKRIVVFGHTHIAHITPMTNLEDQKTIYANSGTWIDDAMGYPTMTFVVITPEKSDSAIETLNLYQYSNDKTITQWVAGQAITK